MIRRPIVVCLCLVLATLASYAGVCRDGFVNFDDHLYASENWQVRRGPTLAGIIWAFQATGGLDANWHPLTWISLQLDSRLFGTEPWGYHLTNLVFHTANGLLVFWVFYRMTTRLWSSALVAALFALHPLHVESVAWISERKDVLSTFFWALALVAYVRYTERPVCRRYALVALIFALGLMAKPMVVTLPCLLLLLDFWPLDRWRENRDAGTLGRGDAEDGRRASQRTLRSARWRWLIVEKLPLFALAFASCLITLDAQQRAMVSLDASSLSERLAGAVLAYSSYVGKAIWPRDLCVFYPRFAEALTPPRIVPAALFLVAVSSVAVFLARRRPYLAVGWFWFLGTLVPVIGLVQVGRQSMADRYTYVPLIGLFLVAAWGLADVVARWPRSRTIVAAITAAACVACAVAARAQVGTWRDSIALWRHAVSSTRPNATAYRQLGQALFAGAPSEGTAYLEHAAALDPNDAQVRSWLTKAHRKLAIEELRNRDVVLAQQHLERVERLEPPLGPVPVDPELATACEDCAWALIEQGKIADAIWFYRKALQVDPCNPRVAAGLGEFLGDAKPINGQRRGR